MDTTYRITIKTYYEIDYSRETDREKNSNNKEKIKNICKKQNIAYFENFDEIVIKRVNKNELKNVINELLYIDYEDNSTDIKIKEWRPWFGG